MHGIYIAEKMGDDGFNTIAISGANFTKWTSSELLPEDMNHLFVSISALQRRVLNIRIPRKLKNT